jgi:hydrogenase expression/formation protein HypC
MCLALPMRVTAVEGTRATIAVEGLEQECSLMLVPAAGVGDYVLVHAGYAISVLSETEAEETYDLLREIGAFEEAVDDAASGDGGSGDEAAGADGDA